MHLCGERATRERELCGGHKLRSRWMSEQDVSFFLFVRSLLLVAFSLPFCSFLFLSTVKLVQVSWIHPSTIIDHFPLACY